ncbi:LysR family transcriptional regulator [Verticiella sediminum]|uniref:LysR family transcriptional regulator n=1 Tax=Verticiella sediminum TaxID=1247510 RepID=A0A556AGW8_9BURK|nr:LysR family transcriptional regulator [Verticiella sediminum]TSH92137.1 LysR family transcriptional regulator [Verticiella sediminum]
MNLRQMEVFHAVMTTGSISDAARLLHVSAPAVSRVLSHTESRLGFPLFERIKGRLYATSEARHIYQEVEQIHRRVQRVSDLTHELAGRRQRSLSVASSPSIGQVLVPLALGLFRQAHPGVKLHFRCLSHAALQERLLTGEIDVGVSILPMSHPNLESVPLVMGRLLCLCPPAHQLARRKEIGIEDLRDEFIITYSRGTPFGSRIERLYADNEEVLRSATEVGSPQNACALVHAGAGVALVDEFSLLAWPMGDFRALQVRNAPPIIADLVHLRTESLSPLAHAFAQALRQVAHDSKLAVPHREGDLTVV